MERKEQWIESTLQSADGAGRAQVNPALYERLMATARQGVRQVTISKGTLWRVAAGIVLLIALNFFSMARLSHKSSTQEQNNFAQEYFSYGNEIQF